MFSSTKVIELGSCAFRQPSAKSHCQFLHGYRLTAKFWFEADELDENNWVVDFGGLKELKKALERMFDHTTVIASDDPHIETFYELEKKNIIVLNVMENGVGIERFAEWCWNTANVHVQSITNGRCRCIKAEVFEHEKNSAIYETSSSRISGVRYMKDLTNEIDERFNDSVETNEKIFESKQDTTRPPFAHKKGAAVGQKKITNKWIDPDSTNTWGI